MAKYPYRTLGTVINRLFRNDLNSNFTDIESDLKEQKGRVDNLITGTPQPSEVVDARGGKAVLKDRLDAVDTDLSGKTAQIEKINVTYEQFGAKLDGVTDDTAAIRAAHNYANSKGYPIVQRNSKFKLNGSIDIKTPTDLSGSELITTWVDSQPIEYNRTSILFNIKGEDLNDITSMVTQSQFTKGATRIPSLANIDSGTIIIKSTDLDMIRNDGGNVSNIYKQESNILLKNGQGDLLYPLTKEYSASTGFQVLLRKDESKLTFKLPKVTLDGAGIYAVAKCFRNNVEITSAIIEEKNASSTVSPLYTICEYMDCSKVEINNISCPVIGRTVKTGENGLAYLFLFTRVSNIRVNKVFQISGWSGINGNWFRDVEISNCNVVTIGGHVNTFDLKIRDSLVFKEIIAHGGGLLHVKDTTIDGRSYATAIETRVDYASEWDGTIRLDNIKTLYSTTLLALNSVTYDCGRNVVLPNVEVNNPTMENLNNADTKLVHFKGFSGNFSATLPSIKVDGTLLKANGKQHRTVDIQTPLSNTAISGTISVKVRNLDIPRDSFESDIFNATKANFVIPSITNANVFLNMEIKDSVANLIVYGTSNATVKYKSCDVYIVRSASGTTANVTSVGNPLDLYFDSCIFNRPSCDIGGITGAPARVRATVTNSKYVRFKKADGTYDNQIAYTFEGIIVYAKNNVAEVAGTLPGTNASRLFDYIDTTVWKIS